MYAGRAWQYRFRQIKTVFNEKEVTPVVDSLSQRYTRLARQWSPERNSEWLCRTYLASKMVMAGTLSANSLEYAEAHNLRSVIYYLRYYTLLSLFRAVMLMLPEKEWNAGALSSSSHKTVINDVSSFIACFDASIGKWAKEEAFRLKAARELISYRAPSSGDRYLPSGRQLRDFFELITDLAQFSSELLEASIEKHSDRATFVFLETYYTQLWAQEINGICIGDPEDRYRLDCIRRKQRYPANLQTTLTEGHIESFFGSWCAEENDASQFDPDDNWEILFDLR
jgi:hypothetical protein